ncbi:TPA: hypothetical protein ACF5XO_000685 [Legionella pneumophila]|nr:hypothetical protein [Legionella pneumophila]HBD7078781.1 hypothetical protein [Legionella pneumophila]HCC0691171.1 hypothetical protein [Legionella pneumophila]
MKPIPSYVYNESDDSLQQGDIIRLSGYLRQIFKKYYSGLKIKPYEIRYLMVINQSCDLVNNNERKPKSEHINLCVVSKFSRYLDRIKTKYIKKKIKNHIIIEEVIYQEIKQKIARLINNSESKEHFFLPRIDPFKENMVAVLSFSYPFRCKHYDLIKKNRVLSLKPEFQAKVGYLIGNLYNRIATPDLNCNNFTDQDLSCFVDDLLSQESFYPVKHDYIKFIQKNKTKINSRDSLELLIKEAFHSEEKEKLIKFKRPLIKLLSSAFYEELKGKNLINPAVNQPDIKKSISVITKEIIDKMYTEYD